MELVTQREYIYCPTYLLGLKSDHNLIGMLVNFSEECSNKGGVNAGSCASGFGVCCTCKNDRNMFYDKLD